jgi:signal transduction histidine kinase
VGNLLAQSRIDSLLNILNSSSIPLKRAILNELIDEYQSISLGQSLEYGNEALNLARENRNDKWIIDSYLKIGQIYLETEMTDEALDYYKKAEMLSGQVYDSSYISRTLHSLGVAWFQKGDTATSFNYLKRSIRYINPQRYPHDAGEICKDMADFYFNTKNFNDAYKYYKNSLKYFEQSSDYKDQVAVLCKIAATKAKTGYYFDARILYLRAMDISQEHELLYYTSYIAFKIAEILFYNENNTNLSITHLNQALKIAIEEGSLELQVEINQLLSEIFESKNKFKTALNLRTTYFSLKDSLRKRRTQNFITFLDMKYDLDKYKNEISLLSSKYEVSQKELEKQDRLRKFIIIALILFSIMGITSFGFFLYKKNMLKILNEKKEALETSNKVLLNSKEQLNRFNETKNKIFSVLAHDLINPFNALLGFATLLKEESNYLNKKEVKQYGEVIYQTATNLLQLLENLLQWSKSQTGQIVVNKKNTDINKLINKVLSMSKILSDKKNIRLETHLDTVCVSFIDEDLISSALRNIIQNAIKFTPEGKMITITTNCTELKTTIIVADTGTGISEKDQKRLFRTETHFTKTGTANEIGTGLGLIITREFIKLNNGKLDLESKIGQGSTFKVTLPGKRNNKL